jgi:hypothetical protein
LKPPTAGRLRRAKTFISCTAPHQSSTYIDPSPCSWHT